MDLDLLSYLTMGCSRKRSGLWFPSLIEAFQMPDIKGNILDVGCGYGPIGLSLAKEFQGREVHMVDVNERALGLAKENAANNKIENIRIFKVASMKM